jgi:flagellar biosynthetic protein FliR
VKLELSHWFLVFARAGALLAVFPLFSEQEVPVRLRLALAALMSFLATPLLPVFALNDLSFWSLIRLVFTEASVGLLLGFVCRFIFYAIDFAGGIVGTEVGLMLSSAFNPLGANATPVPGIMLYWLALMLLLALDLHHWIIAAFQRSYVLLPIGAAHLSQGLALEVLRRSSEVFRIALEMTAPVIAVSFVITLVFSVLSRAVPQMNVFTESFPVRTLAGLAVFGLTFHLMAQHIENYLRRLPEDLVRIGQLLGTGA